MSHTTCVRACVNRIGILRMCVSKCETHVFISSSFFSSHSKIVCRSFGSWGLTYVCSVCARVCAYYSFVQFNAVFTAHTNLVQNINTVYNVECTNTDCNKIKLDALNSPSGTKLSKRIPFFFFLST